MQEFKILGAQEREHGSNASDISRWSIDARYETRPDRIASAQENDWDRLSCSLCCKRRRKKVGRDNPHPMFYQFGGQGWQSIVMTIRRAVFDRHVLARNEADFAQTLPEGIRQRQRLRESLVEESYHRDRLLCARRERPRCHCAAEKRDELSSFQLIELHLILLTRRGCIAGYRIGKDQSAGRPAISQPAGR
jgi:hypothetical protein